MTSDFRPYRNAAELKADIRRALSSMPKHKPGKLDRNGYEMKSRTLVEFTGSSLPSTKVSGHAPEKKLFNLLRQYRFAGAATCQHVWISGKGEIELVGESFTAKLPMGL